MTDCYRFDRFEVQPAQRRLLDAGQTVAIGARALDLLVALIVHRERMLTKDELLAQVWPGMVVEENNLTVQISALRKLLGAGTIATVSGRGYRFTPTVHEAGERGKVGTPSPSSALLGAPQLDASPGLTRDQAGAAVLIERSNSVARPAKASIVVLPFDDFSQQSDFQHFTDGLTEDITTDLSRFSSIYVVSRTSAFTYKNRAVDVRATANELGVRYVLEGSMRHANNRIRVSAQLIDAQTGNHLWAEKYDRVLADIFDVQEEVTRAIVGAIAPQIEHAEGTWARRSRPENLAAYGLALRAWTIASSDTIELENTGRDEAFELAHQALKLDPSLGMAWRSVALIQWTRVYFNIAANRQVALAEGIQAAERAIALDNNDYVAMTYKGMLWGLAGNDARALAELRAAHEINRNYVLCLGFLGMYEAWAGNINLSVGYAREAVRLSPRDPYRDTLLVLLGFTCFANHLYEEAVQAGELALRESPNKPVPHLIKTLGYVGLGELSLAQEAFQTLQARAPAMAQARLNGQWLTANPAYLKRAHTFVRIAAGLESPDSADALR